VANGYARNYLLPQEKGALATPQNRRQMENERAKFEDVVCQVSAKVSEEDRLYGSVTVGDIIDALAAQDIVVEKRMILLKEPLKTIGSFKVPIRVYN
jgi:large subunit ribosomal protein L9